MFRRKKTKDGQQPADGAVEENGAVEEAADQDQRPEGSAAATGDAGEGTGGSGRPGSDLSETAAPVFDRGSGPLDLSEVTEEPEGPGSNRVDLGALRLLVPDGVEVRVEMDPDTNQPAGVTMRRDEGFVQLRPVSAPRSGGLWDEVRAEILEEVTEDGGSAEEYVGEFGMEVRARLSAEDEKGTSVERVIRFVGVDGPKWMLQGVFFGSAVDPDRAAEVDDLFRAVVVVRGDHAMAPRQALPITIPEEARAAQGPVDLDELGTGPAPRTDDLIGDDDFDEFETDFQGGGPERIFTGPTDIDDADETEPRLEMGSLEIPVEQELDVTLEVDPDTEEPGAVLLVRGEGAVQVRPFSAAGTDELWSRARRRIMAEISKDGGLVDERPGPFGTELLAKIPAEDEEGRSFMQPIRIVGVNGDGWLLQGVFLGEGVDPETAGDLENIFRSVVVDPGDRDTPVGHPLPITTPQNVVDDDDDDDDEDEL